MQQPYGYGVYTGSLYKGWFIPPATTAYRFYVTCDDNCELYLGETAGDAENKTKMSTDIGYSSYRDWWETRTNQPRIS
jgi:hypothetical protein